MATNQANLTAYPLYTPIDVTTGDHIWPTRWSDLCFARASQPDSKHSGQRRGYCDTLTNDKYAALSCTPVLWNHRQVEGTFHVTEAAVVTNWAIDSAHSSLEFAVKHMVFATAKGRFGEFSGTIAFDPNNISSSSVDVEIDVSSVTTSQVQRDGHLNSADFFDTENFPKASFKSTSVTGSPEHLKVVGDLTLKDVTKPVTLDAEFLGQGVSPFGVHVAAFSATTKINRAEFGLTYNSALETGGVLIGEDIKLSIELELNPAG